MLRGATSQATQTTAMLRHYGMSSEEIDVWEDPDQADVVDLSANELDALGTGVSIYRALEKSGVNRGRETLAEYSIESKTFSARSYIRDIHRKATGSELRRGKDNLQKEVDKKSDSLRSLVEQNFDRFVGAKSTIDQVHAQIKRDFVVRKNTAIGSAMASNDGTSVNLVDGMRETLNEAIAKGAQIFEPIVRGKVNADHLRFALSTLEQYKQHFDMPSKMLKYLDDGDDEALAKQFKIGQRLFAEARRQPTHVGGVVEQRMLDQVWSIVQKYVKQRELELLSALEDDRSDSAAVNRTCMTLLEIGVDVNPYYRAFQHGSTHLREAVIMQIEVQRVNVEMLRRQILIDTHAAAKEMRITSLQSYFLSEARDDEPQATEMADILRMWQAVEELVRSVFSSQIPRLQQVWQIYRDMTEPTRAALLPVGPNGSSKQFHSFTPDERNRARNTAENIAMIICDSILDFFMTKPITELPPIYAQAIAKRELDEQQEHNRLEAVNGAPPSPSKTHRKRVSAVPELPKLDPSTHKSSGGEFAFVPASTTALGTSTHLAKLMETLIKGANEIVGLAISSRVEESARNMLSKVRDRFVRAICELWQDDCQLLPMLETWERDYTSDERITSMPRTLYLLNSAMIDGLRRVVFCDVRGGATGSQAGSVPGTRSGSPVPSVLPAPTPKLIDNIRTQFAKNMYTTMNGFVTSIYHGQGDDVESEEKSSMAAPGSLNEPLSDADTRALILINNINRVQQQYISRLAKKLEGSLGASSSRELSDLKSMLTHHEHGVFKRFVRPRCAQLDEIIERGVAEVEYSSLPFPREVDAYVNEIILACTVVLSQVGMTVPELESRVMTATVEHVFSSVAVHLDKVKHFNLGAMLKVTTEMELLTQTLGPFLTDKAAQINDATLDRVEARTDRNLPVPGQQQDVKKILSKARKAIGAYAKVFRHQL
ncbi:Exocyst complex component S5 [Savitreella phatthalungensis]